MFTIASTRAFNLPTLAFNLPTLAFNLPTRAFNLPTRAFSLLTRGFELVTRGFELVTRVLLFDYILLLLMHYLVIHDFKVELTLILFERRIVNVIKY